MEDHIELSGGLRARMTVFLDDLQNFNESTLLESYRDSRFMSATYFTDEEKEGLQAISIEGMTLRAALDDLIKKRAECGGGICSSHDLKPIYERYFGFSKSDMKKSKIKSARESWCDWKTRTTASLAGVPACDAQDTLLKRISKAKKKSRKKEVARLEALLADTTPP